VGPAHFPAWLPRPLTSYLGGQRPMAWFSLFPWGAWALVGVAVGHLWVDRKPRSSPAEERLRPHLRGWRRADRCGRHHSRRRSDHHSLPLGAHHADGARHLLPSTGAHRPSRRGRFRLVPVSPRPLLAAAPAWPHLAPDLLGAHRASATAAWSTPCAIGSTSPAPQVSSPFSPWPCWASRWPRRATAGRLSIGCAHAFVRRAWRDTKAIHQPVTLQL
jgi:hypothetical protein